MPLGRPDEPLPSARARRRVRDIPAYLGRLESPFPFFPHPCALAQLRDTLSCVFACQVNAYVHNLDRPPWGVTPASNPARPRAPRLSSPRRQLPRVTLHT